MGQDPYRPLLASLPDISVRFAVASFDASSGLTFGPTQITSKGTLYRAILDYLNVDAIPVTFRIGASVNGKPTPLGMAATKKEAIYEAGAIAIDQPTQRALDETADLVTIPVYGRYRCMSASACD